MGVNRGGDSGYIQLVQASKWEGLRDVVALTCGCGGCRIIECADGKANLLCGTNAEQHVMAALFLLCLETLVMALALRELDEFLQVWADEELRFTEV